MQSNINLIIANGLRISVNKDNVSVVIMNKYRGKLKDMRQKVLNVLKNRDIKIVNRKVIADDIIDKRYVVCTIDLNYEHTEATITVHYISYGDEIEHVIMFVVPIKRINPIASIK